MQVSYLGTDFFAVQRCPGTASSAVLDLSMRSPGVRTVQEEVEKVLESIFTNYSTRPHNLVAHEAAPFDPSPPLRCSQGGQILACMRMRRLTGEGREASKVMG